MDSEDRELDGGILDDDDEPTVEGGAPAPVDPDDETDEGE